MARMFMIRPVNCIIFVFITISFYSCSTVKPAGIIPPMKVLFSCLKMSHRANPP